MRPYAGDGPSHTAEFCATPILSNIHSFRKPENGDVCLAFGGVGKRKPCAAFVVSADPAKPKGAGRDTHPQGPDR